MRVQHEKGPESQIYNLKYGDKTAPLGGEINLIRVFVILDLNIVYCIWVHKDIILVVLFIRYGRLFKLVVYTQ